MIPHVTEVLAPWQDFSSIDPDVLNHASVRGTLVHAACAAYAEDLWVAPLDSEIKPYFQSFQRWFDARVDRVIAVEAKVHHLAHGYTGRGDLVAVINGDELPTFIDIKSPLAKSKAWAAQLAAYKVAWEDTYPDQPIGRVASLRLRKNGGRALFDEYTESARDFAGFLAALNSYKYFRG